MLKYFDGQEVRLGDKVDFDGTPGTVVDIIETPDQKRRMGYEFQAVAFRTKEYGDVYQPLDHAWDETIVLLSRAKPPNGGGAA